MQNSAIKSGQHSSTQRRESLNQFIEVQNHFYEFEDGDLDKCSFKFILL